MICTFAGPYYNEAGKNLVKAVAEYGRRYVNITGEVPFVRDVISNHHSRAVETGAIIVNCAGHDSSPFDLTVQKIAQKLKDTYDEELKSIELYDDIKSMPSTGTIKTAQLLKSVKRSMKRDVDCKGVDPLYMGYDGTDVNSVLYTSENRSITRLMGYSPRKALCFYIIPFFMAGVNFSCVKRSNAMLKYGRSLVYKESIGIDSVFDIIRHYFRQLMLYVQAVWLSMYMNPTDDEMDVGYLDIIGIGRGDKGTEVCARFSIDEDPGYRKTAEMAIETAICLVINKSINNYRGVITPAVLNVDGDVLIKRLCDRENSSFEFEWLSDSFESAKDEPEYVENYHKTE